MKISLVFPVYNEEASLPLLKSELEQWSKNKTFELEIILVNDGSSDKSLHFLQIWSAQSSNVKVISFSRNFGHQAALTAGLDHTTGDAVVIMDSDLQDPLHVVDQMVESYRQGHDVVHAKRVSRKGETKFKKFTAWLFYRIFSLSSGGVSIEDSGDFKLISGKALNHLRDLKESHRFLRGMYCWIGFKSSVVEYHRKERSAGETKYPLHKMMKFAWDALLSFSILPIRLISIFGLCIAGFGFFWTMYSVLRFFIIGDNVQGWTTLVILQCLIGGGGLLSLGIIGEYVGRIYEEIKGRPNYIIDTKINFDE